MSNKRKIQMSDSDLEYLRDLARSYSKKNAFDSKGIMLLCKALFPNNTKIKIMEYEIVKKMGNFKLASSILADNYTPRTNRWAEEVNNIFAGLQSTPVSQQCQKLFTALPHRIQTDMTISYLNSVFNTVESKADFILQFLTNKLDVLGEGSVVGALLENLIDLLMAAEEKHCQAINSKTQNCKPTPSTPQSPDREAASVTATRSCLLNESNEDLETDEGEEGEVLEEADEDDDEEMDDEDADNQGSKLLVEKQCISVLNFHRMRLVCEVFPIVHRMRNGIKISSSQLQTLVVKSFQFLFTFAAQIPFAADGCPEIFGLSGPLPELLKMEPAKYLRLFLDMASDLLKWPVTGPSFQVQPHSDIFDMLRRCYHIYKDLEHDVQRQKGGSGGGSGNNKKRTSASVHNFSTVASQVVCMFWALFIEKGMACLKEFSLRTCVPFCIAAVAPSIDEFDLPVDEPLSESLHLLHSLWSLRLRFKAQEKKSKSRSSRKATSVLEGVYSSLQPQSGVSDLKFSCLLEFFVRVDLTLASLNDTNADFEEVFANLALLSGAYSEEQSRVLQCLLSVTKLRLKPPTQVKQLVADRLRLIYRVIELKLDDDTDSRPWTKLSNQTIVISVASSRDTAEACLAYVERWLVEAVKAQSSVDAACLAFVLHQNPFWARLPNFKCVHQEEWVVVGIFAPRGRLVSESGLAGAGRDTCGRGAVPELELFVGWVRLSQAINALKTPTVHNYLNKSSADKWSGRQANSFTWKSVCDIIVHLLQDELHVATVRRNNVSIMTAEFSESDLKLPLDEVLVFLFGLINDSTLAFLQPFAIDSLSSLLWHLPIETQALEICNLSRLQDWCLDQMKIAPSGPVALLLCHTQNVCFHSRRTLHCNFMSLLEGVLVCFECGWSDSSGLGWFLRLLRWTVAEVCITPDLHRSVFGCFLKRAPILFKLWPKFRETCGQYVPPNLHMLTLDVNDKSSPALAQTVGGCLNDSYALDAYYVTSPVLDDLFINWKDLAKFSSACLLSDACFIAEEKPLLLPDRSSRRPQPNCVDTGRELLAFCRWIINTSVVLKACITVEEIRPFFSLLMNFYTTEWSRHADRMRFQAEDSLCLQLFGMRDFFVTFGTFMEALEAFKMTELLDSLKARSSDCQQPWIYERLFNFVSADDTVGWLCSLAIEAAISTAVTALAISTYYIQHGLENIDGFSSCIDRIWNQALLWFEQLSISNLREDSRYRNEKRRALLHDRLISCLLESLLRLDSVSIASQAYVPSRAQHLSSLWNALLSTTVFGNPFAPWRYRLALFAYLIWPKTSIEIVCTTATPIPPPLVFLLTTHPSASDILRYHFLHWSLSCLLRPENPLPEIFPRVSTVPVFGQKHVQLIEKFVNSHLPEPSDLWTCLFFHLVSPKMIETSCLREAVDYVLVDVEQRYGLVTVLFALLQRVSEKEWPSRLSQLIRSLLAHKSTDQLPETVAAHCVDLDLDDGELSSPICELTVGTEDTMATTHLRSFESKILLPLNAFSHPSLLSMTVKCLQEIMTKLSWRSAYDTKWLAALHRYLRKVDFSPTDNESVVDLFCSLVDALKDALKAQLVLKRWSLFLTTVTALNDFGIVLSACLTGVGDKVFHNEIFEKIARQVIKLAETAWVAGGARWPKFEEGFLPPNLGSVFCDSFGVWIRCLQVFLNRLAGKNKAYLGLHLRPYLMPLCLWELSDGRFDLSTCPREFQAAAIAWGYASFEEFLEQSQEYGAFLQIAGIDVAENHPSRFTYNQIAACLFAKDRFPAYIRTLQTANQKAFKCVCCIEGFVAVTSYLFHFVLLFTSDTSADLDRNASRISYHLVSRLTLLFVELFATHQVDTDKLTCSLFSSSSAADNVEQMASRILSQVASFKADFILNLSEALLEAGCHFLKDPRELGADSMYDPLGGYYPRVSVWLAVARFIILLVSSSPNATPTSNSYLNWRLISGIVNLIDVEYKGNRLHRIGFLLTALLDILKAVVKNTCITSSDQLEVAWHNSTVYQLAEVASKLSALPDDVHLDLSQDLIEILDHLFQVRGGNRFSNAICHLDNIFENNALLTPYQPHFSRYCKCNRRDVDEEIHRFLEWTDFLRHPRLLKYRAAGLRHLTALLRPRHEFTTIQLHERLVTVPHERTEEKLRLLEASSIQNWVPSAGSSGCSDVVSEKQLLFRMLIELSTGNHLVEIDPETRLAMAECVASLKATFIDEKSALKPSERARELLIEKSPDPMVVEQLDCVITIANGIASPNNPRLKMSLLGALNISEAERRICILTKLAPYISTEELKNARGAKPQSALKFTTKNVTEAVLYELRSQALVDLALSCGDCPETTVLKIAEWLFDKALVLDEFFLALKPLIIAEVHMAQRLVPWIFAAIFVNLRLLSVPRTGKDMEQALIYLMGVLNTLLERPQLAQFLQSILIALHTYSQWLIRSGIATNLEWDLNWLSASKLSLNAGLMENAWLFFELAWIKRPRELLYDSVAQNLWIDLCTSQKDLVGLKAAQVAMAQFFDQSADGIALEDRFRCAINELDGRWRLLWEEGTGQGDQSSSADVAQIALRLHRLGADKAFSQLATDLLSQDSNILSALTEAKYRVAWRSDTWGIDGSTKPTLRDNILLAIDFKTLPTSKVQPPANPTLTLQREAIESALGVISNLESIRRECASRMGQWNEPEVTPPSNLEDEKLIYLLYQSACCKDWKYVAKLVNDRRSLSENPVTLQSFASEANILQAWSHISTLLQNQPDASNARVASSVILLQASIEECIEWDTPQLTSLLEASLRLSKALSDSVDDSSSWLPLLNVHTQLQLADSYIERGNVPCAERLLRTIPRIEIASGELNLRKNLSFALARSKLQRLCGETSLSCARLTGVLNDATEVISNLKLSHDTPARLLLESYLSCTVALCKWLAECSAMSLADIVVRRLKPAIELADKCWSSEAKQPLCNSADALAVLAEFADAQYQVFDGYLRSPEFAARRRLLSDADADAACLTEVDKKSLLDSQKSCEDLLTIVNYFVSRFLRLLQRQSTLENVELVNLLSSLQNFFSTAILSYCQCLARSDKFNLKIYRLVSLWLNALSQMAENRGLASCDLSEGSATESLFTPAWLASLEAHLGAIRVDKFLPLFSQLLVRLTTPNEEERRSKTQAAFHAMLAKLVKTLLSKHPYHTGLPLLSLVNAPLDDPQGGASSTTISRSKRQRIEAMADRDGGRVALARQLFSEVCRSGATREDIFAQMQALATAYIEWANVDVENKRNVKDLPRLYSRSSANPFLHSTNRSSIGDIPMPASCALSRLSAEAEHCLHLLPVITCPPRVNPSGVYQDLVRVVGFVNTYRLAGGLNLPKIVTCLCSDGRRRKQLVKGRDDPRQDAIMQQVFSAANHLLATFSVSNASKCPKSSSFSPSRANAMRIRTYMVVPLARRSGLIEWCEGTVPLGEWLAGEAFGAHQRYRPSDLAPSQAKLKLAGARDKSLDRKLAVFTEICSKIQPVLGFFFLEHFPEPSAWYAARWRYTASLATASILGYLVGLGDRHPHNLLLHPTTGEVVHIDLGIAFDQGRLMPTPEMVPFRLTRDLVHALGPLGVEVGFVSIAESALCAFSSGSEIILTLLELRVNQSTRRVFVRHGGIGEQIDSLGSLSCVTYQRVARETDLLSFREFPVGVLLHDPLYSWSLSPAQLCALEARRAEVTGCPAFPTGGGGESSIFANTSTTAATAAASGSIVNAYGTASRRPQDSVNQLAERVLLTVRDKLAGRVGGIGSSGLTAGTAAEGALGTLGPSGHVALLVRAATDPQNLGRMYFGWQAYL
ncbi:Serine-protein kinase ATM [Echinococcus granulosus]|uniref:non-specific serine/threonine protein kinase n=1 Tax=Echinococcus granulosus TaxID=6210 RepID=W6UZR4_ECHGR|nr:Serine-protein kinase ATM [Echinococcus granulosus]EUB64032.1 Serine-protein kinase ATM [Echinococcus granulosus]